jgi:hypothetical protein
MPNFVKKVNVYDNNLSLIYYASFTSTKEAEDYARKLRAKFLDRIGKIELESVYYEQK